MLQFTARASLAALALFLVPSLAQAEDEEPAAAEAPPVPAPSASDEWKRSMSKYAVGDTDTALEELRKMALDCGSVEDGRCTDVEIATLYMCVGIVLSGGKADHAGGVRAFKRALSLKPTYGILPEYRTAPVVAAYREAKSGAAPQTAPAPTPAPAPVQPAPAERQIQLPTNNVPPAAQVQLEESDPASLYIIGGGTFKAGPGTGGGSGSTFMKIGGSVSLLAAPGAGQIVTGVRLHGGTLRVEGIGTGIVGASYELGGVWGKRQDHEFNFATLGVGFDHFPSELFTLPISQVRVGRSFGGFMASGGIDASWGGGAHIILFGVELGFGGSV